MHKELIYETLLYTDKKILKRINNIYIVYDNKVYNCQDKYSGIIPIGCAVTSLAGDIEKISTADIYVVDKDFYIRNSVCSSFEFTLNHEIGHVDGHMFSSEVGSLESYANKYAQQKTINKGRCQQNKTVNI